MTITSITATQVRARLKVPFVTALRSTDYAESVVVEVRTDDGLVGYGESPQVWRVSGESLAGGQACIEGPLADLVRGRDVADLRDLVPGIAGAVAGNFGAKSAVECALHDLRARELGISLPRLLGTSRHRVDTDVTVSAGEPDDLAASARKHLTDGFTCLKLKVGTDAATDVARVRAVRDEVGPDVQLCADANQGWSPRQAVRVIRALEDAGVGLEFVEQPVRGHDIAGLAWVTERVGTPIMADESVFSLRDLTEVIRLRAADLVNIKLAKCGGLTAAAALHELATAHGVGTIVGSMLEGPVGVGAAASFAAAYGTTHVADLDAAYLLAESPVQGGLTYDGPTVVLPDAPGLGIEGLR